MLVLDTVPDQLLRGEADPEEVGVAERVRRLERLALALGVGLNEGRALLLCVVVAEEVLESRAVREEEAVAETDLERVEEPVVVLDAVAVRVLLLVLVPVRVIVAVRLFVEELVPVLELLAVLELLEEAVEVRLRRAVRVELGDGQGVSDSRALRVPVRVEVGEAVGSAPATASSRGAAASMPPAVTSRIAASLERRGGGGSCPRAMELRAARRKSHLMASFYLGKSSPIRYQNSPAARPGAEFRPKAASLL